MTYLADSSNKTKESYADFFMMFESSTFQPEQTNDRKDEHLFIYILTTFNRNFRLWIPF